MPFISFCCTKYWHLFIIIYNFSELLKHSAINSLNATLTFYPFVKVLTRSDFFFFCFLVDHVPVPLTPDYGGPVVRYADGVADLHLNRYITVREGWCPTYCWLQLTICFNNSSLRIPLLFFFFKITYSSYWSYCWADHRESSQNPTTTIIAVDLSDENLQGKYF